MANEQKSDGRPIEVRLKDWLATQGYPLEMRVGAAFQAKGFATGLQHFYRDPQEPETYREIDVIASDTVDVGETHVRVTFVVECKSSRDAPWVLFVASPEAVLQSRVRTAFMLSSRLAKPYITRISTTPQIQALPLLAPTPRPAYGATDAFKRVDVVYDAARSVLKAALAQIKTADDDAAMYPVVELIFPVLITEARLFQAYLGEQNSIELAEVDTALLMWRNPSLTHTASFINVVNDKALTSFVNAARETTNGLLKADKDAIDRVETRWRRENAESNARMSEGLPG